MPAATRVGDGTVGTCSVGALCCPHGRNGTNSSGSPNVFVNSIQLHRLDDVGPTNCPHGGTFSSTSGSGSVFCNGLPVTRIGDSTSCMVCGLSGSHTDGSGNVFVGG